MGRSGRWIKGQSGNPAGRPRKDQAPDVALIPARPRADGWQSSITGLGMLGKDKLRGAEFELEPVNDKEAATIWAGDDLGARMVECWPDDMLRAGFELCVAEEDEESEEDEAGFTPDEYEPETGDLKEDAYQRRNRRRRDAADAARKSRDVEEQVTTRMEELGVSTALHRALCYRRAYGGGAILMGAMDGRKMDQPLREESVRSFDWLTVLEPGELQPESYYEDPMEAKFGQVKLWRLNPAAPAGTASATNILVHESRLIIFQGIRVSERMRTGETRAGWGLSVFTRVKSVLSEFNLSWRAIVILMQDIAPAILKMKNLHQIWLSDNDDAFRQRIEAWVLAQSAARINLIDAEEEYIRTAIQLTGVPDMMDRLMTRLAAAADLPVMKLFHEAPSGLGSNGEASLRLHYDNVDAARDRELTPALEKLARLIMRAEGLTEPAYWSFKFGPLWQPTDKEAAEARKLQMETDVGYITAGVVGPQEIAKSRFGSAQYSFETKIDFKKRELLEEVAPAPVKSAQEVEAEEFDRELQVKALEAKSAGGPPRADGERDDCDNPIRGEGGQFNGCSGGGGGSGGGGSGGGAGGLRPASPTEIRIYKEHKAAAMAAGKSEAEAEASAQENYQRRQAEAAERTQATARQHEAWDRAPVPDAIKAEAEVMPHLAEFDAAHASAVHAGTDADGDTYYTPTGKKRSSVPESANTVGTASEDWGDIVDEPGFGQHKLEQVANARDIEDVDARPYDPARHQSAWADVVAKGDNVLGRLRALEASQVERGLEDWAINSTRGLAKSVEKVVAQGRAFTPFVKKKARK